MGDGFIVMPFTSAGFYSDRGAIGPEDLVELRSGVEATYELDPGSSLGLTFSHVFDAPTNSEAPGSDQLMLRYSFSPN